MDTNGRKGRRDITGQREETNSKGTQKTLVEEETHRETDTPMGTIGTRVNPNITMIVDQRGVPPAEISSQKRYPKTSDQQSRTLGGGPEATECLAGSEAKTGIEQLKTCATC